MVVNVLNLEKGKQGLLVVVVVHSVMWVFWVHRRLVGF